MFSLLVGVALSGPAPALDGTWVLDEQRTESMDAVLRAHGLPWPVRKLMGKGPEWMRLECGTQRVTTTIKTPVGVLSELMLMDHTARPVKTPLGEQVVWHRWTEDGAMQSSRHLAERSPQSAMVRTCKVQPDDSLRCRVQVLSQQGQPVAATQVFTRQQ